MESVTHPFALQCEIQNKDCNLISQSPPGLYNSGTKEMILWETELNYENAQTEESDNTSWIWIENGV